MRSLLSEKPSTQTDQRLQQRALLLIATYFILQLLIRLMVSPGLERDEAEQLLLTQQLQLGYGSQPPLYTWLQFIFFSIFGENIFALALLKNLLLFSSYLFTYKISRALGYGVYASIGAMLSLLFIPQIVWESQRDLSHSVIVTTLTAATVYFWVRLKGNPEIGNYLLLGLCCGLTLISKYNSSIFLLGLLLASITIPEYRALLLKPRILISVLTVLLIITPHLIWASKHLRQLLASTHKFKLAAQGDYWSSVVQGSISLVAASLAFSLLLFLVYALVVHFQSRRHANPQAQATRAATPNLILRSILFSLLICLLMIWVFQMTEFKDRWMQPILFLLPVALLPYMQSAFELQQGRVMRYLASAMAIFVLFAFSVRVIALPYTGVITNLNVPYQSVAEKIIAQHPSNELIVSQTSLMGGHLRLQQPTARVAIAGSSEMFHDSHPDSLLIVWEKGSNWYDDKRLSQLVSHLISDDYSEIAYHTIKQEFVSLPDKKLTVSSVRLEHRNLSARN